MKLIIIRHTTLNIKPGICYGQSDIDVSDNFIAEAEIVRAKLAHYNFNAVYTSPLQRCVKLASFCGYPDAIREPRLMELNFGDWEGQRWDEITDPHLPLWYDDWMNRPTPNGESFMMQYQRYSDFVETLSQQYSNPNDTIALFTHGGIIHAARIHNNIDSFANTFNNKPEYGEILEITL